MSEQSIVEMTQFMLEQLRTEIGEYTDQIQALKEKVKAAKQKAEDVTSLSLKSAKTAEDEFDVASTVYWRFDDIVAAVVICRHFGVSYQKISDRVGVAVMKKSCRDCGKEKDFYAASRTSYKQMVNSPHFLCENCMAKYQAQNAAAAEQYRAYIEQLRTMPYKQYLQTEHWQILRTKMLKRAKFRCQVCNASNQSLQVHHRTYERRGNEEYSDLIVLCAGCHKTFHENGKVQS